ncbi:molybdopterin-guanine dinucleotide biosynthesis protein B [Virgibacillus ainsalahensis]
MEIIQIVGYKNSGKTTMASKLIETLTDRGIRTATLKHHGHGGAPLGMEDTDSEVHRRAGAHLSGVEGEGVLQITNTSSWKMEEMIALYKLMNIEVLILEGFKRQEYNKAVLIRNKEDLSLLEQVTNIKAVITAVPLKQAAFPYPIFQQTETDAFIKWLLADLKLD